MILLLSKKGLFSQMGESSLGSQRAARLEDVNKHQRGTEDSLGNTSLSIVLLCFISYLLMIHPTTVKIKLRDQPLRPNFIFLLVCLSFFLYILSISLPLGNALLAPFQ